MDGRGALVAWDSLVRVRTRLPGGVVAMQGALGGDEDWGMRPGRPRSRRWVGLAPRATRRLALGVRLSDRWACLGWPLRLGVMSWLGEDVSFGSAPTAAPDEWLVLPAVHGIEGAGRMDS